MYCGLDQQLIKLRIRTLQRASNMIGGRKGEKKKIFLTLETAVGKAMSP